MPYELGPPVPRTDKQHHGGHATPDEPRRYLARNIKGRPVVHGSADDRREQLWVDVDAVLERMSFSTGCS